MVAPHDMYTTLVSKYLLPAECDWLFDLILALDTSAMLPSVIMIVQFTRNQIVKQSVFCIRAKPKSNPLGNSTESPNT